MGTGEGGKRGAVRQLLEDDYGLDVEWCSANESFASVATDPDGFNVAMPAGVQNFVDEMERQVPGSRESMTTVLELGRMLVDGVEWLYERHNEPEGAQKVEMMLKYYDLMCLVPQPCDEVLRKIGVPDKARQIFESYWTYVSADSTEMSFAPYVFMTYVYLTQLPWFAKNRSHEISLAFDAKIRELGGDIWYNTKVDKIDIKNNAVRGVVLADGTYIACERVISNLMPHVVFDRMVEPSEVPQYDRKKMNAQRLAQAAFTVYLGLDASAEELGLKNYDTFMRYTPDNHKQFLSSDSIDTHKDITCTVLTNALPDAAGKGRAFIQFSKFYTGDPFKDVTEADYFKIKDRIARECVERYEGRHRLRPAGAYRGARRRLPGHVGALSRHAARRRIRLHPRSVGWHVPARAVRPQGGLHHKGPALRRRPRHADGRLFPGVSLRRGAGEIHAS